MSALAHVTGRITHAADVMAAAGMGSVTVADLISAAATVAEVTNALEWALDRIRAAGLGEGEKFTAAEAALVKAVHS